ncbi:MAG: FAD binding domain-containing protein [Myxococcota bacterium]
MLPLPAFDVVRPSTVDEALRALGTPGAQLVAGGTDLLPALKNDLASPSVLVSLSRIDALRHIRIQDDGTLVIGAGVTLSRLAEEPVVTRHAPAVAQAASVVASPQIRNAATLGGNLCLPTRCVYYNQSAFWRAALGHCLRKDGDVCHVVPGGRRCVAAFTADTPPALMALGAQVVLTSSRGVRALPLAELYVADGARHVAKRDDEIVTEVRVPDCAQPAWSSYRKLASRSAIDFPLLAVAAALRLDPDGRVVSLCVVVSALAAQPRVLKGLEQYAGSSWDDAVRRDVAEVARRQCHPLPNVPGDAEWRRDVLVTEVRRALEQLSPPASGQR